MTTGLTGHTTSGLSFYIGHRATVTEATKLAHNWLHEMDTLDSVSLYDPNTPASTPAFQTIVRVPPAPQDDYDTKYAHRSEAAEYAAYGHLTEAQAEALSEPAPTSTPAPSLPSNHQSPTARPSYRIRVPVSVMTPRYRAIDLHARTTPRTPAQVANLERYVNTLNDLRTAEWELRQSHTTAERRYWNNTICDIRATLIECERIEQESTPCH